MLKANLFLVLFLGFSGGSLIFGKAAEARQFGFAVGGYMPIAVNDEQLLDIADFVVNQINFSENSSLGDNFYQSDKILYAMRQVVAGFNYKFVFLMDQTECPKTDPNLLECLYKGLHPHNVNYSMKKMCIVEVYQNLKSDTDGQFKLSNFECY